MKHQIIFGIVHTVCSAKTGKQQILELEEGSKEEILLVADLYAKAWANAEMEPYYEMQGLDNRSGTKRWERDLMLLLPKDHPKHKLALEIEDKIKALGIRKS